MRKTRFLRENATYHVTSIANRKEMIFNHSEIKEMFLFTIRRAKKKYLFSIKNFCIMGNHFHFIIQPDQKENLSRIMQWILGVFAVRFNKKYNYVGHVWRSRFSSYIINSFENYLRIFIYIALNPVKAKLSKTPVEYRYNGISFFQKGVLDILERPPNNFLRLVWRILKQNEYL